MQTQDVSGSTEASPLDPDDQGFFSLFLSSTSFENSAAGLAAFAGSCHSILQLGSAFFRAATSEGVTLVPAKTSLVSVDMSCKGVRSETFVLLHNSVVRGIPFSGVRSKIGLPLQFR